MTEITPEYLEWRNKNMALFWGALEPQMYAAWQELCEECSEPEPEPPESDYDGGRIQVVWATGTDPDAIINKLLALTARASSIYAVVITADVVHRSTGGLLSLIRTLRANGVKVFAYVRAPVHMRVNTPFTLENVSEAVPFEHAVGELVAQHSAYALDAAGNPIFHSSGYDVYLNPLRIAEEHAALVMEHAWDPEFYDGVLADGLVTNQPYAWAASFTVTEQREALLYWAGEVDAPIVGNGAWEPYVEVSPWASIAPLRGAMDEDMTHPHYDMNNPSIQLPPLSERWAYHMEQAQAWQGKEYWIGDNLRLFSLPEDQRRRFLITSALMVDAKVVMEDHPWLRLNLGEADSAAIQYEDKHWSRDFEGGIVRCFPDRMTGEISY